MIQRMPTAPDIWAAQTSLSGLFKKKGEGRWGGKEGIDYSQEVRGRNGNVHDDKKYIVCMHKTSKNKKITLDKIIPLL